MEFISILWDLDDDPHGNVEHIAQHGLTKDDVVDVLTTPKGEETSYSTGHPIVFGMTRSGERIAVVYEQIDRETIYPITAFRIED